MNLQKFIFGRTKRAYLLFALLICIGAITFYITDQIVIAKIETELKNIRDTRQVVSAIEHIKYHETISTLRAYSSAAAATNEHWELAEINKQAYELQLLELTKLIENTLPNILEKSKKTRAEREDSFRYLSNIKKTIIELSYIESFAFEQIELREKKIATDALFSEHYNTLKIKLLDALKDWQDLESQRLLEKEKSAKKNASAYTALRFGYAVLFIAALFAFLAMVERTTSGLKKIHSATEQVKAGNLNVSIQIDTKDELQEIANDFNEITKTISDLEEERTRLDAAKTRFLSITSHELRSPMTPMKAQLQMLERGYFGKLTGKQLESVKTIVRNAEQLDKIIADFLEISRIEAGRLKFSFTKVSIPDTIENVANLMKDFMPDKKIKIVKTIQKLPPIEADPDRISQVLRNILSNAIKFSPKNSKIELSARHFGTHILVSIKDYGQGIQFDEQPKIFQPFYQAGAGLKREFGGTGLGLAICRGIVTSQNGRIWFESQPGKGTTFYFTIPLKPVREIKPIQLIFASSEDTENQIREAFKDALGTIGIVEFNRLKSEGLDPTSVHSYIDKLQKDNIIEKYEHAKFKKKIESIFKPKEQPLRQIVKALKR